MGKNKTGGFETLPPGFGLGRVTKQILTMTQMAPGTSFMISITYFSYVSPSAPSWQLLPDSPPDINYNTRWIVHSWEISRMEHLSKMAPESRFVISIAYFFKVSHSAPPWQLLPDSPPDIDYSTRWIVHSTEISRTKHIRNGAGGQVFFFNRLFLQSIPIGAPLTTRTW